MSELLLNLFYLVRPIMFLDISIDVGGLNFFEAVTILFTLVLFAIAASNVMRGQKKALSSIEIVMIVFIIWCTCVVILYAETSSFKTYIKWILPLVTYMVLKRTIKNREHFLKLIYFLMIGYIFPIVWNFITILRGGGVGQVIYWTGLQRYSGVYGSIHAMGHNMGFYIMLITIFFMLTKWTSEIKVSKLKYGFYIFMAILALYCLYKSQVRTVYVGLLTFYGLWLYRYNKKLLSILAVLSVVGVLIMAPLLDIIFFDVIEAVEGKRDIDEAGSGRPFIWEHNLTIYAELGIDRKLAGVGIGNTRSYIEGSGVVPGIPTLVWNSHNDYLEVLMETGLIGFVLQMIMYFLMYRRISRIKTKDQTLFMAIFMAVVVMNILSNSYISRFGLAQLFFMMLVYIELPDSANKKETKRQEKVIVNTRQPRLRN